MTDETTILTTKPKAPARSPKSDAVAAPKPAKTKAKAPVADENDPLVVNGVRFPNKTRANEARRAAEARTEEAQSPEEKAAAKAVKPPKGESKHAKVLDLLRRPEGASLAEIMAETGWLKHTSSAFISIAKRDKDKKFETTGERGALRYRLVEG